MISGWRKTNILTRRVMRMRSANLRNRGIDVKAPLNSNEDAIEALVFFIFLGPSIFASKTPSFKRTPSNETSPYFLVLPFLFDV
jgi:hypothetical protein